MKILAQKLFDVIHQCAKMKLTIEDETNNCFYQVSVLKKLLKS